MGSDENSNNLLDKLQDAIGRGQNPISIFPSDLVEPEIITISDPDLGVSGTFDLSSYDSQLCQVENFLTRLSRMQWQIMFSFSFNISGSGAKYTYDRFPSNIRTEEQEEKRKQILATASGAFEYSGKLARYIYISIPFQF